MLTSLRPFSSIAARRTFDAFPRGMDCSSDAFRHAFCMGIAADGAHRSAHERQRRHGGATAGWMPAATGFGDRRATCSAAAVGRRALGSAAAGALPSPHGDWDRRQRHQVAGALARRRSGRTRSRVAARVCRSAPHRRQRTAFDAGPCDAADHRARPRNAAAPARSRYGRGRSVHTTRAPGPSAASSRQLARARRWDWRRRSVDKPDRDMGWALLQSRKRSKTSPRRGPWRL